MTTTIVFYWLLLLLISKLFFKTNYSVFCCGLTGFCGVKDLTPEQERKITQNLKIILLYNQERGEHGCGMWLNGQVLKGYDNTATKINTKKISDFLANDVLPTFNSQMGTAFLDYIVGLFSNFALFSSPALE